MGEKELTNEESLALISDMICQAKRNVARGGSFYFLLWGGVVVFANLSQYLLNKYDLYEYPYIVWLATIPAAIISVMRGTGHRKRARVRSHLDGIYGLIWLGVSIGIVIVLVFMEQINYNVNGVILILAGLGTFISGCMLRFRPLVVGGIAIWICSIIAFNLPTMEQSLVGAVAISVGYIVPGYLLKRAEREQV